MDTHTKGRYAALGYRDFRLFLCGQGISMIGTYMQLVGINWHIYLLTKSAVALGILGLLRFLPMIIFGLLGGLYADVHNRKTILFITQSSMTFLSLILVVTTGMGQINAGIIYLISVLMTIANSFDIPARQALIPSLVEKKDLGNAISLNDTMYYLSAIIGPALSGFIIARFGVQSVYLLNTLSFIAVLGALGFMKTSGVTPGKIAVVASLSSIIEGVQFVKSKTIIWSTMLLDFFSTFFASASALLPIFAQTILAVGPIGLGFLYAAESIGALAASAIIASLGSIKQQGKVLLTAVVFYALGTILFGISRTFLFCFIGLVIVGAGDSISAIIRNNIRQLATPDSIRGRMVAVNMIFFMGGPQLGEFEAGLLAGAIGAPWSVILGGIGTLLVVGIMAGMIPLLRNYQTQPDRG